MISVSKLCCPVCWELFKVLKMDPDIKMDIKISGCHPTITPVALPETFPAKISEKIVVSLRPLLTAQLSPLLETKRPASGQHYRNVSETGHSAASSNEGASKCLGSYETWQRKKKNQ